MSTAFTVSNFREILEAYVKPLRAAGLDGGFNQDLPKIISTVCEGRPEMRTNRAHIPSSTRTDQLAGLSSEDIACFPAKVNVDRVQRWTITA